MSASRDALIRAVDALQGPQGATPEEPVAPPKCLKKQAGGHRGHRGHSKTIDHDPDEELVPSCFPLGEQRRAAPTPKIYPSSVAPVAHVDSGIDSKGKNRGHTIFSCGPLWPPDSGILPSIPDVPARWIQGIVRLGGLPPAPNYPTPAARLELAGLGAVRLSPRRPLGPDPGHGADAPPARPGVGRPHQIRGGDPHNQRCMPKLPPQIP